MNIPTATNDPRGQPDFEFSHYPKANGKEAPPANAGDRNERIVLEFLAIYYALNREHAKLRDVRQTAESPQRTAQERERLQTIEKVLIQRDSLEDQCAPIGIIAEPVVQNGFTVDVRFTFGSVNASGRLRGTPMTSSTTIPIRLPPGVKIENLTLPRPEPPATE
jgi:hypothetical protein